METHVESWKRTTEGMHVCGHRHGAIIALWPGDILALSWALRTDAGFDVFLRVGDPRSYEDEELELSTADAGRWLAEANLLSRSLNDPRRTARERMHEFLESAVRPADLIRLGWEVPPHAIDAFQSADGAATTAQTVFASRVEGVLADGPRPVCRKCPDSKPIRLAL